MKVGGSSDWPQNSIDHTFGCFGAKFNFQVLSMSADLGLDEKFSRKFITTHGTIIHVILEQIYRPPYFHDMWYQFLQNVNII